MGMKQMEKKASWHEKLGVGEDEDTNNKERIKEGKSLKRGVILKNKQQGVKQIK